MGAVQLHALTIEAEHRRSLAALGLDTLEACLTFSGGVVVKAARPGRDVIRLEEEDRTYFLKRVRGRPWREIPHEVDVLSRLVLAGLPVPVPAAFGATRGAGVLITEGLPAVGTLEEVVLDPAQDPARVERLLAEAGRLLARLHRTGTNHRDYYANHLLLDPEDRLMLVDLGRAEWRRSVPERRIVKDLAALAASLPDEAVARGLAAAVLAGYSKVTGQECQGFYEAMLERRARMREHARREVARGRANFHVNP
jgi:tRNA A-37 threonylcarbamoyl transferase component Bud32